MSSLHTPGSNSDIRPEALSTEASQVAEKLIQRFTNKRGQLQLDKRNSVSSSQLRKFFYEFKGLEKKLNLGEESFGTKILPLIKMIKSKVAYASNPDNQKIPPTFKDFLMRNIDEISTVDDFKAFMLHFEAVVGFCYGLGLK